MNALHMSCLCYFILVELVSRQRKRIGLVVAAAERIIVTEQIGIDDETEQCPAEVGVAVVGDVLLVVVVFVLVSESLVQVPKGTLVWLGWLLEHSIHL